MLRTIALVSLGIVLIFTIPLMHAPDPGRDAESASPGATPGTDLAALAFPLPCRTSSSWLLNTTNTSPTFHDSTAWALLDVQCVRPMLVWSGLFDLKFYDRVEATDIPDYQTFVDDDVLALLALRPAADFVTGTTSLHGGETIAFGTDIGFHSTPLCDDPMAGIKHEGVGYWPRGPACPTVWPEKFLVPLAPARETSSACHTNSGAIGKWLNGVSMFNYWDDQTVSGVWHRIAYAWEKYDLDICSGHGADSGVLVEYHHHSYPVCLGDRLNDRGRHTSPILGYAADGYPVLGPWVGRGALARTCWKKRDYDTPSPVTGCDAPGARTCLLEGGVKTEISNPAEVGPTTTATMPTTSAGVLDDRTITTESGVFVEDYYWDPACVHPLWDVQLDFHNGHWARSSEAGDYQETYHQSLSGYHYHTTRVAVAPGRRDSDGDIVLEDVFPFIVGPTFFGKVPSKETYDATETREVKCNEPW